MTIRFDHTRDEFKTQIRLHTKKFDFTKYLETDNLIYSAQKGNRIKLFLSGNFKERKGGSSVFYGKIREEHGSAVLGGRFKLPLAYRIFVFIPQSFVLLLVALEEIDWMTGILFSVPCVLWFFCAGFLRFAYLKMTAERNQELMDRVVRLLSEASRE